MVNALEVLVTMGLGAYDGFSNGSGNPILPGESAAMSILTAIYWAGRDMKNGWTKNVPIGRPGEVKAAIREGVGGVVSGVLKSQLLFSGGYFVGAGIGMLYRKLLD